MEIYHEKRPWGEFYNLEEGDGYKIKKIIVNKNSRLSLQSHKYRAEHWVIVKGNAKVIINDSEFFCKKNDHIYIGIGDKHRIENISEEDVIIIETQLGSYLGEDDIIRYNDDYGRI